MNNRVVIIDYGVGNLFSIQRAFSFLNIDSLITRDKKEIMNSSHLLLPGVGAFQTGILHLEEYQLISTIEQFAQSGRPVLGICLGMQLLMTDSHENGYWNGLNLIKGSVLPLEKTNDFKVPHIGWNDLLLPSGSGQIHQGGWSQTVLGELNHPASMYFLHSYYVRLENPQYTLSQTKYGVNLFASSIKKDNVSGVQFHPERSGKDGLKILKNFATQKLA